MPQSPLIDAGRLKAMLEEGGHDILVVDCRYALLEPEAGACAYSEGHIPTAVHADLGELLSGPTTGMNGRHPLPDPQAFVEGMASLGANDETLVMAYDAADSMFAARLWWLLRWIGHENVRVLDGGLQAWRQAGGELSTETPRRSRGTIGLRHRAKPTVTFTDVLTLVQNGGLEKRERLMIDARSPDRYRGENETIDPAGGHIPGAVNRYYKENLDADGRFKEPDQLWSEFAELLGNTPAPEVIHQCGSGVTACHNLLAMEVAGMESGTLYPGSWSEWCRQRGVPISRG